MKILKSILLAILLLLSAQAIAGDCAVGYAFMQNGQYQRAYSEFRPLAERGYAVYMNIIADMHLKGQGVPASDLMAHVWYSLSAALDNDKGINGKSELAKKLSDQQLVDSRLLAHDFAEDYLRPYVISWSLEEKP